MQYKNASISDVKKLVSKAEHEKIEEAYRLAKRFSESKQLQHQLNTALILSQLGLDTTTIMAALMHELADNVLNADVESDVKDIVNEITKLRKVKIRNMGRLESTSLANIMLAIAKDVRSIIVELASQLDRMRFLSDYPKEEQIKIAELSLNVYATISHKLGLYEISRELQDLAMKRLWPDEYQKIKALVNEKKERRAQKLEAAHKEVMELLRKEGFNVVIQSRVKNFYSIYRKMKEEGKSFDEIQDLLGIRIICKSLEDCYNILSLLKRNYEQVGKFYDYIVRPKENMYRSIHITLKIKDAVVEVQIRTFDMHKDAEYGVAAHWRYKKIEQYMYFDTALSWARQLVELQRKEHANIFNYIKHSLVQNNIFVLTPKNDVVVLPKNATALDFAYAIHSDIGNRCRGAIVNGEQKPLSYTLESGDTIEILTGVKKSVNSAWLSIVRTSKAKNKIRKELNIKAKPKKEIVLKKDFPRKIIMAKCCTPLFGDDVIAYRTTKRKITVHRADCAMLSQLPDDKKFRIDNKFLERKSYVARIEVKAFESPELLTGLLNELQKNNVKIVGSEVKVESDNIVRCIFDIDVKNLEHLERINKILGNAQNVIYVERI